MVACNSKGMKMFY